MCAGPCPTGSGVQQSVTCFGVRRPYLQELFAEAPGKVSEISHTGDALSTALATCQDYTEEISHIAHQQVYNLFMHSLVRHLTCCIACQMLLSSTPYDSNWQRQAHLELSKLRHFLSLNMGHDVAAGEQCLTMLSLLRSLLCAPDSYTAVSSFTNVRLTTVIHLCHNLIYIYPVVFKPAFVDFTDVWHTANTFCVCGLGA